MSKRRLCLALIAVGSLLAQTDERFAAGLKSIRQKHLKADLTFLSSPALEGRLSLTKGDDTAVQWIASEFAKAGLQPVAGDSFYQTVPLIEYQTDKANTRLTLFRGQRTVLIPEPVVGYPFDVTVQAPIVFAGYGITAPEYAYDDYAGIDVQGKVVLLLPHEPQENDPKSVFNGTGMTLHANSYAKLLNAQKHGAAGVILMTEPYRNHHPGQPEPTGPRPRRPLPQALVSGEIKIPLFSVPERAFTSLIEASGKPLEELRAALDRSGQPGSFLVPDSKVEMHVVNSAARRANSHNVLGMVEGSDPVLKKETILISAHHDHDGSVTGELLPGADDNGSGTVGVIELARAFASNPNKPKRTVVFAVFTAEERGLLGAYYYTAHPLRPLDKTRAVINFDMIGRDEAHNAQTQGVLKISEDTTNELNLVGLNYSPDYRAAVEKANQHVGLLLNDKFDRDSTLNVFFRSDQYPFVLQGIPAMWWFTGFHPDYHQPTDTVEKINFAKMEKILKLAYLTTIEFAENEVPRFRSSGR